MTSTHPSARVAPPVADAPEVQRLLLAVGEALTVTGSAVSEIQARLRTIAAAHGYGRACIAVLPTLLIVELAEGDAAAITTVDPVRQLRLDQISAVIDLATAAEQPGISPCETLTGLERILGTRARFGAVAQVAAHAVLTVGLALIIRPAAGDLWLYVVLGALVGALRVWAARFETGGHLLPIVTAALVSAVAFLAHGGNDAASLRLTIPPLVTFLPGALLTMATVDLAMGETITGASRFVAGLLQLALLAIGVVIGAELVGDPHTGPIAGPAAHTLGAWTPWAGVAVFGLGVFVHKVGPRRSLPWLLLVLFMVRGAQVAGEHLVDATLSGFVGAVVMVPLAHLVSLRPTGPAAHVTFVAAFWLIVPGTVGLIGITEIIGDNARPGSEHLGSALVAIPSVALGILVGTMVVRAARAAWILRGAVRHTAR